MNRGTTLARIAAALACAIALAACSPADPAPAASPPGGRVVRHGAGETTIVGTPSRVVAFAPLAIEALLAIGIRPVAMTEYGSGGPAAPLEKYPPYLASQVAGIPTVGSWAEPDLEAVLALKPDLIVCTDEHMRSYDLIQGIAPTILLDQSSEITAEKDRGWRRCHTVLGEALQKQDEARRRIAEYDAKAAAARDTIRPVVGDETVLLVRMMPKGFRISGHSHRTTGHLLYTDVGLRAPPASDPNWEKEYVPLEQLAVLDPDWILVVEGSEELEKQLLTEPLWKSLRAVRNGRVRTVGFFWIRGHGWYGKMAILDQLVEVLVGRK